MKNRIEFIADSISDIQDTIRAIDAKFFGIIVILLLPLTELGEISNAFKALYKINSEITVICLIALVFCWVVAILVCMLGVYSESNPIKRIKGYEVYKGENLFYRSGLFNINMLSQFFPFCIMSVKSLEDLIKETEIDEAGIINELAFEQVKLSYIRDLKISRQRLSVILLLFIMLLIVGLLIMNLILESGGHSKT